MPRSLLFCCGLRFPMKLPTPKRKHRFIPRLPGIRGAETNLRNSCGTAALTMASKADHVEVARLLLGAC